jgi:ribosomal protein S24E
MELKILDKKEEPLLFRTKIEAEITFDKATPSKSDIKSTIAKDLSKDVKLIVVKKIDTKYGFKTAKNVSYAYENEKAMKQIEPQPKEGTAKEAPKAEKPESKGEAKEEKAAKNQEAKKEEKAEQPKEEAKKAAENKELTKDDKVAKEQKKQ